GLPAMIRLRRPDGDQRVRTLLKRLTDEEFKFARLVAAKGEAGLVVPLDEQVRSTEFAGKTFQLFNRGWQLRQPKAREFFDLHWDVRLRISLIKPFATRPEFRSRKSNPGIRRRPVPRL